MDWMMPWRRQISATDSWPLSPSRTTSSFALAVQRRRFSEGCCFSLISSHSRDGVFDERAHSPLRHCQPAVGGSIVIRTQEPLLSPARSLVHLLPKRRHSLFDVLGLRREGWARARGSARTRTASFSGSGSSGNTPLVRYGVMIIAKTASTPCDKNSERSNLP